jgi:hypothetical protein
MSTAALTAATAYTLGARKDRKEVRVNSTLAESVINKPITWLAVAGIVGYTLYKFGGNIKEAIVGDPISKAQTTTQGNPWAYGTFFASLPKGVNYKLYSGDYATKLANYFREAIGFTSDDEDWVKTTLRDMPSKVHVAQVAERYAKIYSHDLLSLLKSGRGAAGSLGYGGLSESDLKEVLNIVNKKPTYIKA